MRKHPRTRRATAAMRAYCSKRCDSMGAGPGWEGKGILAEPPLTQNADFPIISGSQHPKTKRPRYLDFHPVGVKHVPSIQGCVQIGITLMKTFSAKPEEVR